MIYNEFYKESISKTICDVFGKEYKYKIISKEDVNKYKNINKQSSEKEVVKQVKSFIENEYSDKFTFDTYLRSEFNKECVDICKDIAEQKSDLNILFISGASGIGKTHLLQAVGNRFEERGKKSIYINPLIFNKKILLALQENNSTYITKILNHLSSVDIVLFDDFQIFGEGKKANKKLYLSNHWCENT
ncbi:DnaA/Hda family protein [Mycoplasmopsis cynos]|uniref:DnaA ATPase domain-containing protein n=1 Tax=Mycoplasmopsis cynos TaxID=171284 RepID=UPI0024C90EEC|nr:DnaA/Hda family protein [Mycoplasmopsis cynos]WAM07098.1 DnaA/Hda family protein [Mycoplasmopsis cynos]